MSTESVNYEAVLADLEFRKSQLESAIAAIRSIMGQAVGGPNTPGGGSPSYSGSTPAHDAFIGMSIPDAAKKHLLAVRKKLSTQEIMTALEAGGLPPSKYSTVYAVLRRRESQVGDIINLKGDWALQEWYPNYRKGKAREPDGEEGQKESPKPEPVKANSEEAASA